MTSGITYASDRITVRQSATRNAGQYPRAVALDTSGDDQQWQEPHTQTVDYDPPLVTETHVYLSIEEFHKLGQSDCALIQNRFRLIVLEELDGGLCHESDGEIVMAVMSEHRLQEL